MSGDAPLALVSSAATRQGAGRERNEDAFVDRPDLGLWAVADGAGGHGAGEVASAAVKRALEAIPPGLSAADLLAEVRHRLAAVHAGLRDEAGRCGPGRTIATTVVAVLVRGEHFACLWAGDSRAYLLRGGALWRLTRDHSLVQEMVDRGEIAEAEAEAHPWGNVISRAVGADGDLELEKVSGHVAIGDRILLCSDGLHRGLSEHDIVATLGMASQSAASLTASAAASGARDDVTAVVLQWIA